MMFFNRERCRTIWLRRHLPAKRLRWLVRNPDLRQKAAGVELSEHAGVDRIGLDVRMGDDAHLLRVCDHDLLDVRRDHRRDRGRVAGRLNDDHLLLGERLGESLERMPLLQAHPTPLVGAHSPDRLLDRVERSDPFERLAGDRRSALGLIEDPAAQMRPAESERDPAVEPPGGDRLVSGVAVALDDALLFVEHLQASPRSPRAERDGALHERIRYSSRRPPDRLLHHAVVIQIEGASYRLREHADLLPENVRFKLNAAANPIPPTLKRRGRPPKNGGADHPLG